MKLAYPRHFYCSVVPSQESQRSCICVLGVSIQSLSIIALLDKEPLWYLFVFFKFNFKCFSVKHLLVSLYWQRNLSSLSTIASQIVPKPDLLEDRHKYITREKPRSYEPYRWGFERNLVKLCFCDIIINCEFPICKLMDDYSWLVGNYQLPSTHRVPSFCTVNVYIVFISFV